jgi:hypothetical protein
MEFSLHLMMVSRCRKSGQKLALENPKMQTRQGNPKVPSYMEVSFWTLRWISTLRKEKICHAFKICGLVKKVEFDMELLHRPLKALFDTNYCREKWEELDTELLGGDIEVEPGTLEPPEWYLPEEGPFYLFQCFWQKMYSQNHDWKEY